MKIEKLLLQNFRSFGPQVTTLRLNDLTALIGTNGSGKTNALLALVRMFGLSSQERTLEPADFYVPPGSVLDDEEKRSLVLEAHLSIPEIDTAGGVVCPPVFQQMLVTAPDGPPFCRMRLAATWSAGPTPEGEVEQSLCWLLSTDPEPKPEHISRVAQSDRAHLQVHYVPATRDPVRQLRNVSTTVLARLLRAVDWSDNLREVLQQAAEVIVDTFAAEAGMKTIATAIGDTWSELSAGTHYRDVALRPATSRLDDWLRRMEVAVGPAPDSPSAGVDRLSEGQKSLFYISLITAAFALEEKVANGLGGSVVGLQPDVLSPPALSLLALEEPENHLSPHYLGRIKQAMDRVTKSLRGQVIYTSHAPSMLTRVEPEFVRHFRLDPESQTTQVAEILLPEKTSEAHTYVREAVRAFPELYFARIVILGEGDSEQVVLPRLAEARGEPLDPRFVAVVPLGGRHVNHLWKLLTNLEIPFVTLLDLDRERVGGGWARVHYAFQQLIRCGRNREALLEVTSEDGKTNILSESEFEAVKTWDSGVAIQPWLDQLEEENVFFSAPLDLDFLLLRAFPNAYRSTVPKGGGPRVPASPPAKVAERLRAATASVLKDEGGDGSSYTQQEMADFPWYVNLFLSHSKPTTHLLALASLQNAELVQGMPDVLTRLLDRTAALLDSDDGADT